MVGSRVKRISQQGSQVWVHVRARNLTVQLGAWDHASVRVGVLARSAVLALVAGEDSQPKAALPPQIVVRRLTLHAPDLAGLTRLLQVLQQRVDDGQLDGMVWNVRVELGQLPTYLRSGLLTAGTQAGSRQLCWHVTRNGQARLELGWSRLQLLPVALGQVQEGLTRQWRHRQVWTQPAKGVQDEAPGHEQREPSPVVSVTAKAKSTPVVSVITTMAHPCGRELAGHPARYVLRPGGQGHLDLVPDPREQAGGAGLAAAPVLRFHPGRGPEAVIAQAPRAPSGLLVGQRRWHPFSVVRLEMVSTSEPFAQAVITTLQACGAIVAESAVDQPGEDLTGDTLSTQGPLRQLEWAASSLTVSRAALIRADPLLSSMGLLPDCPGSAAAPPVSVVISSKRPDDLDAVVQAMAAQTYPSFEVLVGAHGWQPRAEQEQRWADVLGGRLRLVAVDPGTTFGHVLGQLSRRADAELITKVDDDDRYGPHHLTDLVVALRTSGADLVAKTSRFTYLADHNLTLDRAPLVSERYGATPAGGTMLLPRATLGAVGGWGQGVRHVDTDLVQRLERAGGTRYRTAAFGYVYVRRGPSSGNGGSDGHTWAADTAVLRSQANHTYEGIPEVILQA